MLMSNYMYLSQISIDRSKTYNLACMVQLVFIVAVRMSLMYGCIYLPESITI